MGRGISEETKKKIDVVWDYAFENNPVTVRGCCYHLFTKGLIKDMSKSSTGNVSRILVSAREEGKIPWDWIVDEGREVESFRTYTDLAHYAEHIRKGYTKDPWLTQPKYVQLWAEKGTHRGLLAPVLNSYVLPLRVMHGFTSATCVNDIAKEVRECVERGQYYVGLYVGDWDPSGLHMSREDLPERIKRYTNGRREGDGWELKRIALTHEDISSGIPSFPLESKIKDPRYDWYRKIHKDLCWEVDAMDPKELRSRLEEEVVDLIDWEKWKAAEATEAMEQKALEEALAHLNF